MPARRRAPLFERTPRHAIIGLPRCAAVVFDFGASIHFESASETKDIAAAGTPEFLPPVYSDEKGKNILADKVKDMTLAKGMQADCHAFGISIQKILEAQSSDRKPRPRPPVATLRVWPRERACTLMLARARGAVVKGEAFGTGKTLEDFLTELADSLIADGAGAGSIWTTPRQS